MRGKRLGRKEVYWVLKVWRKRHRSRRRTEHTKKYTSNRAYVNSLSVCP
jgi:hypothetical protein